MRLWLCCLMLMGSGCVRAVGPSTKRPPDLAPGKREVPAAVEPARVERVEAPTLRLPAGVVPTSVSVKLRVVPGDERVSSTITQGLRLSVHTDQLWLNATGLTFGAVQVEYQGQLVKGHARLEGTQFALVEFDEPVGPGEAVLTIDSSAVLSRKEAEGIFAGTEGADTYVYTQFEALGARRAFPCFDEPGFKVPWQLTLTVPSALVALSNTPGVREEVAAGFKTVTFAATKPLPSYLIAFAVGPFEVVEAGTAGKNQVPVRIITPKGQAARAKWAAEMTGQVIDQLEAWFGTPYPFEKADQLAVASSTFGGAMENPGLITWAQSLLLSPVGGDTVSRKRDFVSTATHELAHQWFGNLVTLAWWDDVWLNEAFADWLENHVLMAWKPEWRGDIERVESRDGAMQSDSLVSARRIREPIVTHDDVLNVFDSITYSKGASVLYMFEQWLGEDVFQRAVRTYLQRHARKNATADDFLEALSEAAGRDVSAPFKSFLDQPGAPLVSVALHCGPQQPPTVELTQQRFVAAGVKADAQSWVFPVCLKWPGGQTCVELNAQRQSFALETKDCPAYLIPNVGMAGYYRSRPLDAKLLAEPSLNLPERVGLSGDLAALVHTADASIADQLALVPAQLASGSRQLTQYATWPIYELDQSVPPPTQRRLAAFVQKHFGPMARGLGFAAKAQEDAEIELLRPSLLRLVGDVGEDQSLRAQAKKLVRGWLAAKPGLSPELVSTALMLAAKEGDAALFEALFTAASHEADRKTRRQLLVALGEFRETKQVQRAQSLVLRDDVDPQEAMAILWAQLEDHRTREAALGFVTEHYQALVKRLPEDEEASLVYFGTVFCTKEKRQLVESFFKPKTTQAPGGPRTYANALEAMDQCVAWREKQVPAAISFFEQKSQR